MMENDTFVFLSTRMLKLLVAKKPISRLCCGFHSSISKFNFKIQQNQPDSKKRLNLFLLHILFVMNSFIIITNNNFHYINMSLYFMKVQ